MSFADHVVLWLHVTAAIFTIGPGTAAIMATPRFIRKRNTAVVGYLFRTTRIYSVATLLTLVFGLVLAGMTHKFSQWWISVSLTLVIVAFVLLVLVIRDQGKALAALDAADRGDGSPVLASPAAVGEATTRSAASAEEPTEAGPVPANTGPAAQPAATTVSAPEGAELRVAAVERGRIASIGGLTALIWLVILVFMVWH